MEYKGSDIVLHGATTSTGLAQRKALIRFYFNMDPPTDFDSFAKIWQELKCALIFDGKMKMEEPKKG